jgi:hypothetical protein
MKSIHEVELSPSRAAHLLESQKHFMLDLQAPRETSDAMQAGIFLHEYFLENKPLAGRIAVKPAGMTFASKEGKAWRDAMQGQGLHIMSEADMLDLECMIEALTEAGLPELLSHRNTQKETLLRGVYDEVKIKGYVDAMGPRWVMDIKTARDASPHGFAKAAADQHYLMKAAWYCELAAQNGWDDSAEDIKFVWPVVENKAPYCVVFYEAGVQDLRFGKRQMEAAIRSFKDLLQHPEKPAGYQLVQTLQLPAWYLKSPLP